MTLQAFVTTHWFPEHVATLAASTQASYRLAWTKHLQAQFGEVNIELLTVPQSIACFAAISAAAPQLSRQSLIHLKAVLSSILAHAIRSGLLPLTAASLTQFIALPKKHSRTETHAYTLEQLRQAIFVLAGPARLAVALAGFAGLRQAELQGLRWSDWRDGCLFIERACWRGIIGETKNRSSCASMPVITPLAEILAEARLGAKASDFIVGGSKPVRLDRLLQLKIYPTFRQAGLPTWGMHAWRRGCATSLYQAGVPDLTISRILRHSSVDTTRRSYIKTAGEGLRAAMEELCK